MWAVIISILGTALLATILVILFRRRSTPHFDVTVTENDLQKVLPALAGLTRGVVFRNNAVSIHQDAEIFSAMVEDIDAASHSIHFETFVWSKGKLAALIVTKLIAAAARGVKVRLLLDAVGSQDADQAQLAALRDGGVMVALYRELRPWNLFRINHRTHRKLLIVDGRIGYCFGHGIADQWYQPSGGERCWRDTGVRLTGPAVAGLQQVFYQNWLETTHSVEVDPRAFPGPEEEGTVDVHVVSSAAGDNFSDVSLIFKLVLAAARSEVLIQNPYFVPEADMLEAIRQAAERGVRIRLMLPGKETDSPFVALAAEHLYPQLLAAGVELYEYGLTLCHQKIVIADERWCQVGSTNMDARSLELNCEVAVGIDCAETARLLKEAFEADLAHSRRLDKEDVAGRPWYRRWAAALAYRLNGQL